MIHFWRCRGWLGVGGVQKTKVGLAVGKLRKHEHKVLASEATKLVAKWKKAVAVQAGSPAPPGPATTEGTSVKQSSAPAQRQEPVPAKGGEEGQGLPTSPDPMGNGKSGRAGKRPVPVLLSDPTRQRVLEMLAEALTPGDQPLPCTGLVSLLTIVLAHHEHSRSALGDGSGCCLV